MHESTPDARDCAGVKLTRFDFTFSPGYRDESLFCSRLPLRSLGTPNQKRSPTSPTENGEEAPCLLVFAGCEHGIVNRRRTAGESESAEGPMNQPCDIAYWRRRSPTTGRGVPAAATASVAGAAEEDISPGHGGHGELLQNSSGQGSFTSLFSSREQYIVSSSVAPAATTLKRAMTSGLMSVTEVEEAEHLATARSRTWIPEIPPWFRPFDHGASSTDLEQEEALKQELLSPPTPPPVGGGRRISRKPENKSDAGTADVPPSTHPQYSDPSLGLGLEKADTEHRYKREEKRKAAGMEAGGACRESQAGSFVVRETEVPGVLQLLFVIKTDVRPTSGVSVSISVTQSVPCMGWRQGG